MVAQIDKIFEIIWRAVTAKRG
ncbi:hypothetical protein VCHC55A1_1476, partial [Vibrio cholerae HC-55A1]